MRTKRLFTDVDRVAFRDAFVTNKGTTIKSDYLQGSEVWGCYQDGRLVGGFIINRTLPLRYLQHFSSAFGRELLRSHQLNDITEITCIWHERDRNRPFSALAKTELYLQSVLKAVTWQSLRSNTPILGGSFEAKIARRQRTLLVRLLIQETIEIDGQLKNVQLYYAPTRLVVFRFPIAIARMLAEETKKAFISWIQFQQHRGRRFIENLLCKDKTSPQKNGSSGCDQRQHPSS